MTGTSCLSGISVGDVGRVDPSGLKWVITWQRSHCDWPDFTWECDTDVPVLLFAYVGTRAPWKKSGVHIKRGVVSHHDPHIYFPYQFIVCQNESGLTTHHTFTWQVPSAEKTFDWRPPGDNVLFWWRCGGRTSKLVLPNVPIWTASRSPFYNWRCPKPLTPAWIAECLGDTNTYGLSFFYTGFARTFVPQSDYNLAYLLVHAKGRHGAGWNEATVTVTLAPVLGDTMQPGIATCTFNTADLPNYDEDWAYLQLDLGPVLLTSGQEYAVQFPPGICGDTQCWYWIRTSVYQYPINVTRGFESHDCGITWSRILSGDYDYFHGKFYQFE